MLINTAPRLIEAISAAPTMPMVSEVCGTIRTT